MCAAIDNINTLTWLQSKTRIRLSALGIACGSLCEDYSQTDRLGWEETRV